MSAPSLRERYIPARQDIQIVDGHGNSLYQCLVDGTSDQAAIYPCIFPELSSCLFCPVFDGTMPLTMAPPAPEYTKPTKKGS
jgi:hypothetical protein